MYGQQEQRRRHIKDTLNYASRRRKRSERMITLRKARREEHLAKRRREDAGMYEQEVREQLNMLPMYVQRLRSQNIRDQLESTVYFRKLLSIEKNPPLQEVVRAGVVPFLVNFLGRPEQGKLQFEALWAITNICSGPEECIRAVLKQNAVPMLIRLLQSPFGEVREQAVWCLGNIAGEGTSYRDYCLKCLIIPPLLQLFQTPNPPMSLVKNAVWTVSNLCRGKPAPPFDMIRSCLGILASLVRGCRDVDILVDACWALSYISDGQSLEIQAVLDQDILKPLIQLLYHQHPGVQTPALRTLGNIATGNDAQTQAVIDAGALIPLQVVLQHTKRGIKKEAVWMLSNIAAGTRRQVQEIFEANLFPALIHLMVQADFEIRRESAWVVSNACATASHNQVGELVSLGCVRPLCDLLILDEPTVVVVALEGIEHILKAGQAIMKISNAPRNPFCHVVEQADGLRKMAELQQHRHIEIYKKCQKILRRYFDAAMPGDQTGGLDDDFDFDEEIDADNYDF